MLYEVITHVRLQPVTVRRKTREPAGSDHPADLGDDVADAVGLQLLRVRALLLDVATLAVTEGRVDLGELGKLHIDEALGIFAQTDMRNNFV